MLRTQHKRRAPRAGEVDCPYCEGDGEIFDESRVRPWSIDPPTSECPECRGTGIVSEDEADKIDLNKSPGEYAQEDYETYLEERWEWENER